MTTPIVEMDGDEMTRILEDDQRNLLEPYIELNTEYYDLVWNIEMRQMIR